MQNSDALGIEADDVNYVDYKVIFVHRGYIVIMQGSKHMVYGIQHIQDMYHTVYSIHSMVYRIFRI